MKNFQPTISILIFVLLCGFCGTAIAAGGGGVLTDPAALEGKHFHSKGKMPSKYTVELQNGLRKFLPFEDERDFQEAKRGFIAAPAYKQIMAEAGNVLDGVLVSRLPAVPLIVRTQLDHGERHGRARV